MSTANVKNAKTETAAEVKPVRKISDAPASAPAAAALPVAKPAFDAEKAAKTRGSNEIAVMVLKSTDPKASLLALFEVNPAKAREVAKRLDMEEALPVAARAAKKAPAIGETITRKVTVMNGDKGEPYQCFRTPLPVELFGKLDSVDIT